MVQHQFLIQSFVEKYRGVVCDQVIRIFFSATPEWRASVLAQYKEHIAVFDGVYDPGTFQVGPNRGKRKPMPAVFPETLVNSFRKALPVLQDVIEALNQVKVWPKSAYGLKSLRASLSSYLRIKSKF